MFQRDPDLVEAFKCGLVQAACLAGHSQHLPAEVDGDGLRLIAILLPIGVDDQFDDVGVEQRGQRGQAVYRHAEPNRHARHRDKFGSAGTDRARAARLNALAVKTAVGFGESCEIVVNVRAQALGKVVPGGLGRPLMGGSVSRRSGQPSIAAAQAFHARAMKRRAVLFDASAVVSVR